jgi:hypothetical protein
MSVKIEKLKLKHKSFAVNALALLPSNDEKEAPISSTWAVFTHGYTASKTDVLPWAVRCSEGGVPSIIFDLPGHYLGSYNEVNNFEEFKNHASELFYVAFSELKKLMSSECERVILSGQSLGALLSGWALDDSNFGELERMSIGVGLGLNPNTDKIHIFESNFYQKALNIRRQLVSDALDSDVVFAWIKDEKEKIKTYGHRIHLITGEDDVVVGKGGMAALAETLERNGCEVTMDEPKKLPHHQPELAAAHVFSFIRKNYLS